jgi:hypothetical protein
MGLTGLLKNSAGVDAAIPTAAFLIQHGASLLKLAYR